MQWMWQMFFTKNVTQTTLKDSLRGKTIPMLDMYEIICWPKQYDGEKKILLILSKCLSWFTDSLSASIRKWNHILFSVFFLQLHQRLHSGIKPFACNLCPKAFTKKHHLKVLHMISIVVTITFYVKILLELEFDYKQLVIFQ